MLEIVSENVLKKNKSLIPVAYNTDKKIIVISDNCSEQNIISESSLSPVPYLDLTHNQRSMIFISGPSGSGKSSVAYSISLNLRIRLSDKKRKIVLFTKNADEDPAFKSAKKIIQIGMFSDPHFIEIEPSHLSDCIVVFDDWEVLPKNLLNHVSLLIKDLAERSRKLNISLLVINHQTQNYNVTRNLIFESDSYVLFPSANRNAFKRFAKSYMDITDDEIQNMIETCKKPHTWLIFHKSVPRFWQTDKKIIMLE